MLKNGSLCRFPAAFHWNEKRSRTAIALALGKTQSEVAAEVGVPERTQRSWLSQPPFAAEVDRLSLLLGIASRAQRLRLAMRVVRQKTQAETVDTDKDLLDWLKFAQSETDGIKLNLTEIELDAAIEQELEAIVAGSAAPSRG